MGAPSDRRPRLPLALLSVAALLLLAAPEVLADALTPESGGSPNADKIDSLYKITLYIAAAIVALVEGVLIWSLVKYRARRDAPPAAQIRGNTPLEIGWTLAAALILVVLTTITFLYLGDIKNPPPSDAGGLQAAEGVKFASIDQPAPPKGAGKTLEVGVNGQQYLWRYDYSGGQQLFSYHELVAPVNTTVILKITSSDVAHSWWVPKLGGKVDAIPGHTNETWFKGSKVGVYEGVCAELCGDNHADMRTRVRVVPVDEFQAWVQRQRDDIQESQRLLAAARKSEQDQANGGEPADGDR